MLEYNFINNSLALTHRIIEFETYESLMKVLNNRKLERVELKNFKEFTYKPHTETYDIVGDMELNDIESVEIIECPAYAFSQLTRNILKMGNVLKLINTIHDVDTKIEIEERKKYVTEWIYKSGKSKSGLKRLNEIMQTIWKVNRTENARTKKVFIFRVFDIFTTSKGGDGRCIATERYIHIPDNEIISRVCDEAKKTNSNLKFTRGRASPLMTSVSFVDNSKQVNISENQEALLGIYCQNSEFKYSSIFLKGYLYIPEHDIEFIGSTYRFTASIKHVGQPEILNKKIETAIKTVLGRNKEILRLFKRLKTCKNRAVAIDFESTDENDKNYLALELGMTKKIDDLITIQKTANYPKTVEGVVLTLMDYGTNYAVTDTERENVNSKIEEILRRPDTFVINVEEQSNRADAIEF